MQNNKISLVGLKSRDKVIKGVEYVAEAVKSTIGPFGMNALLEKGGRITNDGVTIARELCGAIEDEYERLGANIAQQGSSKTNDQVGDATSTCWALKQAILKEIIKYLPNDRTLLGKKKPSEVLKLLSLGKEEVIEKLNKMAIKVKDEKTLIESAKVSVEDEDLAMLIGHVQWQLGPDGYILAEETAEPTSSIEMVKGIRIDNGFGASFMINNFEKQTLELDECAVILTNYTIPNISVIKDLLDTILKTGQRKIVIVARGFTPEAIKECAENHKTGVFLYPINAPYTDQAEIMRDLASVLGGTYIDSEEMRLEDAGIQDVGSIKKLVARRYDAIFTGFDHGDISKLRIIKRIDQLEKKLDGEVSDFEQRNLQSRISQLNNGFAILKVGAKTVSRRQYLKDKADDAVNAVRHALRGGTVAGAGLAFKEISDALPEGHILKKPLLCINDQIMDSAPEGFVVEDWVRDPLIVLTTALENACDVAGTLATVNIATATATQNKCKLCDFNNKQEE